MQQFPSNAQVCFMPAKLRKLAMSNLLVTDICFKFPFEINEIVWIVKPAFRAPLGEFRISKAVLDDKFELIKVSDNTLYPEEVEGKYLRRDPFAITH